jgi:hypothetical protein
MRGFQTQGVNNQRPDDDIVYEKNVLGKVVVVLPQLGTLIMTLRAHMHLVFLMFGLFVITSFCIRWLLAKPHKRRAEQEIPALHKTAAS